jgi:adenylate cyclase
MIGEEKTPVALEIGHVLFVDIIGYSKLMIHEQLEHLEKLREIARATETFRAAQSAGKLMRLPTGDGGALVFRTSPEEPVKCALEIARELRKHPQLRVRMGIHSGPVKEVTDLSDQGNIAGAGINIAQRVMDCGDAGHILVSKRVADDLEQYGRWRPLLHDLGTCEVKHGVTLGLFNLYSDEVGNPEAPRSVQPEAKRAEKIEIVSAPLPRKSIAILPFENLSEDKANEYFADGIQEEILTRLSRIRDLKVISRTSTQRFKSSRDDIAQIAKQLGVANILEGTVQKAGDQVRVNVQLIDAANDSHLWAERYDHQLINIFAIESDIAAKIADALHAKLSGAERRAISTQPTANTEAYQLYLKARHQWRNFFAPGYEQVRKCFQRAIELDPSFASAYAGLGSYHAFGAANAILPPAHWPAAETALQKTLELDDTLPDAYHLLAGVELYYKRNWPAAERAFLRGAELNPSSGEIPHHYGLCLVLFGRSEEGLAQIALAKQLDPFFPGLHLFAGRILFFLRDYDGAIAYFTTTLELQPTNAVAHEHFGDACERKGMLHEAITQWCAALTLSGQAEEAQFVEQTFAASGFDAAVRALAQKQLQHFNERRACGEYVSAWNDSTAYLRLGDKEQAFVSLAKTVEEPNWFALQLKVNPVLDPLRSDPRFESLVQTVFNPK